MHFYKFWFSFPKSCNFPRNSEVKTKKKKKKEKTNKGLRPQIYGKFPEIRGESTKITKKHFLVTNSKATTSILGVSGLDLHSSSPEPVNFFGHNPRLGGAQFSFGEAQAVIWGGHGSVALGLRRTLQYG